MWKKSWRPLVAGRGATHLIHHPCKTSGARSRLVGGSVAFSQTHVVAAPRLLPATPIFQAALGVISVLGDGAGLARQLDSCLQVDLTGSEHRDGLDDQD